MTTLYTTGYSTRTFDQWVRMVRKHNVNMLVDVRTLAKSHHTANKPEFAADSLAGTLPTYGIAYHAIPTLGGYRHFADTGITPDDSPNRALCKANGFTSSAFRSYADYMYANPDFRDGIAELLQLANRYTIAYFCCEGWERRCHRNLISDYLTAFNLADVYHIKSGIRADRHERIELGVVRENKLVYPA